MEPAGAEPAGPAIPIPKGVDPNEAQAVPRSRTNRAALQELYEQALTPAEQDALQELKSASFKTDVAVIRILQVRLLRMAASVQTVGEMIELLQAYGMSLYRMAKVLETEQRQGKDQDPMADVLSRSLSRALKELENG